MKAINKMAIRAVFALAYATSAVAWSAALTNAARIEGRIADNMAASEDAAHFGCERFAPGWTGSLSGSMNGATGNSDNREISLAGRFRYNTGAWSHTFAFGYERNS